MKVYLHPPANLSRAMFRVASALTRYAPPDVEITRKANEAELTVLHVVGEEDLEAAIAHAREFVVIQYCYKTARGSAEFWQSVWERASLVWSYYDLPVTKGVKFLHAPLGVDVEVFHHWSVPFRAPRIVTSGYVSGPQAEAIAEVSEAAARLGIHVTHLGPSHVEGMAPRADANWHAVTGVDDDYLARLYAQADWVSGLRHVEGFELPALEALAVGSRPVLFDRPDMRQWYDEYGIFVPECAGPELVEHLGRVFSRRVTRLTASERDHFIARFDWKVIAKLFWEAVLG